MEAGRNLFSTPSFPPRTRFGNSLYYAASTAVASTSVIYLSANCATRDFSTSVLQDQRDEVKPLLRVYKEEKTSQLMLDRKHIETRASEHEDKNLDDSGLLVCDFRRSSLHWPGFSHGLPSFETGVNLFTSVPVETTTTGSNTKKQMDIELNAVIMAMKALSASKQAASLSEGSKLAGVDSGDLLSASIFPDKRIIVRSTRLLERRSKRRKVPKLEVPVHESYSSRGADIRKRIKEGFDPNDPLRLFLARSETKQLLTFEEESELVVQVQELLKLQEVKRKIQSQFGREPTLVEWAKAVGLSGHILQSQLQIGTRSHEKLIYHNLRLVVHVAKQYHGRGIGLQELLQEGSMGLMRSIEKFKPQAGCRFATYAYWWIRQTIRKAIFQHSRTIRLPENVYTLHGKVLDAKRLCIQEGNHNPSREELAVCVGITVEKLEKLLLLTRTPLSMQQLVWADQNTTFQEITADTRIEIPDVGVAKQFMRQHVRHLLGTLNVRERQIIRLRFGIEDGKQKSLSEIGNMFGLSKERVRQIESRALYKLKQCLDSHGLESYVDLLV